MSLLLDALKKAAKDKQSAAAENTDSSVKEESAMDDSAEQELVLSLDDVADEEPPAEIAAAAEEHGQLDDSEPVTDNSPAQPVLTVETESVRVATSTVSDEALQLLVFKTNREHRRKQKIVWSSVAISSVIILMLGGYYFYSNMVKDVESLERKHRIAIQKVNAEVIKRKRPELIASMTNMQDKVEQSRITSKADTAAAAKQPVSNVARSSTNSARTTGKPVADRKAYSLQKTQQQNPVSVLLTAGWNAYNNAEYGPSELAYNKVLRREKNNRDALLGIAAIAVKQGQSDKARAMYNRLLRLNPRDPIAFAALTNIEQQDVNNLSESKLKILLKQQPDAAHINFALGNIYAAKQAWPEAQNNYFAAWQADNSNADYAFNLAVSLDHIGKPQQAKRFYKDSIALAHKQNHSFSIDAAEQRLEVLSRQP